MINNEKWYWGNFVRFLTEGWSEGAP